MSTVPFIEKLHEARTPEVQKACPTCGRTAASPGFVLRSGNRVLCSDPFHPSVTLLQPCYQDEADNAA